MTDADNVRRGPDAIDDEAWRWVLIMTSGHATPNDIAELERWCKRSARHAEAYAEADKTWHLFGPAIKNVTREATIGRRTVLGGMLAASAAGAAFVVARPPFGLWPSLGQLTSDYRTATGEQFRIALTDRASVDMNTRTSLNIRPTANDGNRVELIAGEAAIATNSKPIEVIAANGRAWADAAQFNVRYDGPEVCVSCLAGVVQVAQQGRSVSIEQKQQITYTADGFGVVASVDPAVVAGWQQGELFFEDEPLAQVVKEVNRYRPGRIVLLNDTLGQRRFTAHVKLNRLDVVITELQLTFGARVTSLPGGLVLIS